MKKYLISLAALAIMFVSCNKEELTVEPAPRTVNVTAAIASPGGDAQSRISYTPTSSTGSHGIVLEWEEGDRLTLCFVHNGSYYTNQAFLIPGSIDESGKTAVFTITVPSEIPDNEAFDLYGVYQQLKTTTTVGSGGLFDVNSTVYWLYNLDEVSTSLDTPSSGYPDIGIIRPMLYFSKTGIVNTANPDFNYISLQHSGWLMALHFKNTSAGILNFPMRFIVESQNGSNWVWNGNITGTNKTFFNVATGDFSTSTSYYKNCYFSFNSPESPYYNVSSINGGESYTFYRWIASGPNVPELKVKMTTKTDVSDYYLSTNLSSRTVENGKVYHVYTEWDGTNFNLVSPY